MTLTPGTLFAGVLLAGLDEGAAAEPAIATPVRAHCSAPRTFRLRRFEDHSAQLLCGRRVIVRISVPG
ncbi:MAG TPA: hypothetical protein VG458_00140 [Solirubrobacterales bacterium]|nr:hypothetical protein [Solirubrobacterales bacterium]